MQLSIQAKNGNPKVLVILIEGELYREVLSSLFRKRLSKISSFSSLEEFDLWFKDLEMACAKEYALKLLSLQSSYSTKLSQKLKMKGFSEAAIRYAVGEVTRLGYLNDADAWESMILREIRKGFGPRFIFAKLCAKKVEREQLLHLLNEHYPKEEQIKQAKKILHATRKSLASKAKAAAFLQRRGFDHSLILEIL